MTKIRVIFVCLGNICRSPMAKAIFTQLVDEAGLSERISVDSAGTSSWHVGERAHPDTRKVLIQHGISYNGRARRIHENDVSGNGTYVIALDRSNLNDLRNQYGALPHLHLLMEFAPDSGVTDVPDPYYIGNFEYVYSLVEQGCQGLLEMIRRQERI